MEIILYKDGGRIKKRPLYTDDYYDTHQFKRPDSIDFSKEVMYWSNTNTQTWLPKNFKRTSMDKADVVVWQEQKNEIDEYFVIRYPSQNVIAQIKRDFYIDVAPTDIIHIPALLGKAYKYLDVVKSSVEYMQNTPQCNEIYSLYDLNFLNNGGCAISQDEIEDYKSMLSSSKELAMGIIESCDIRESAYALLILSLENKDIPKYSKKAKAVFSTLLRTESPETFWDDIIPNGYKNRTYGAQLAMDTIRNMFPTLTMEQNETIYNLIIKDFQS